METINEVLRGKTALVTGANSGIGKATAQELARMGARVVMVSRSEERGREAQEGIQQYSGNRSVDLLLADLSSQAEVRNLAQNFNEHYDRLDILVNNAGVIQRDRTLTEDGIETTFAVNHLAAFLLTNLLSDRLREGDGARVVTVSSEGHRWGGIDFDDLNGNRKYRAFRAYGQSKLANILFTSGLAERMSGTGVTANCFHPGGVRTNFGFNGGPGAIIFTLMSPFLRSPEEGADTGVYLAASREVEGMTGKYLADRRLKAPSDEAYDKDIQERLWRVSEELTGLSESKLSA